LLYYQKKLKKGEKYFLKFKKEKTTQEWLPFECIYENGLIFYKNYFFKILKINPINYDLKSNLEKESILNSYKIFLKSCDFDIQILIQSKKEDISKTISNMQKIKEKNEKIEEIKQMYIKYINQQNVEKKSASKNFYIIIRKKIDTLKKEKEDLLAEEMKAYEYLNECYFKIKETLTRCGNIVNEVNSKKEITNIFNSFIK